MKITRQMVVELNDELRCKGCCFRYKYDEGCGNPQITLVPVSMNYISSYIFNLNKEFYEWLEDWFAAKNIILSYNNTKNIIWSLTGWND